MEHAAEIAGIIGAVLLDQARRLDDAQELGLDPGGIEAVPGNVVERPRSHCCATSSGPVSDGKYIEERP